MLFVPRWHPRVRARITGDATPETIEDYSGSDIESDEYCEDDQQPSDIELSRFYDREYLEPLLSLIRFVPSPEDDSDAPPLTELWGTRPFGFNGLSVAWTILRVEIDDDEVDDPDDLWREAGVNPQELGVWYKAFARRATPNGTPPESNRVLARLWIYDPRNPTAHYPLSIGNFWIYDIARVTNERDLRRISKKVNEHMNHVGE
ncbi:hypothetical protein FRC03_011317 [Tulasnella sp. 419]|nr:hypothetical protein FRC02_010748 [Tulasnella sp. 418]KAG8955021.1 hypothetical protein FRC03_011317 [Tulasnella sp. 419]